MKKRSALYYKAQGTPAEGSPVKAAGAVVTGAKGLWKLGKGLWKYGGTADVATAGEYTTDWPKDMSTIEKVLRTADDWTTLGLGSYIYDNRKDIKKRSDKVLEDRAKRSTQGFDPFTPKW